MAVGGGFTMTEEEARKENAFRASLEGMTEAQQMIALAIRHAEQRSKMDHARDVLTWAPVAAAGHDAL